MLCQPSSSIKTKECASMKRARECARGSTPESLSVPGRGPQSASKNSTKRMGGNAVNRPRAADDFAAIRARMEELGRERERRTLGKTRAKSGLPVRPNRNTYWSQPEISA